MPNPDRSVSQKLSDMRLNGEERDMDEVAFENHISEMVEDGEVGCFSLPGTCEPCLGVNSGAEDRKERATAAAQELLQR